MNNPANEPVVIEALKEFKDDKLQGFTYQKAAEQDRSNGTSYRTERIRRLDRDRAGRPCPKHPTAIMASLRGYYY